MAGFWGGFAQGWQAEGDRIEKRKMFEEELKLKKEETLLSLAPKYAALRSGGAGGSGGGGEGGSPASLGSVAHYEGLLADYKMDPEHIARISAAGGAKALSKVLEHLESGADKDYPLTPEYVNLVGEKARITVTKGGNIDLSDLQTSLGIEELSPAAEMELKLLSTVPDRVDVGVAVQPVRPVRGEEIARAEDMLNGRLRAQLAAEKRNLQEAIRANPEMEAELSVRYAQVGRALEEIQNDNPVGALSLMPEDLGYSIMQGVLSNNPRLKEVDLGVWEQYKTRPESFSEPASPTRTTPPPGAITLLRSDPSLAEAFDEKYGAGASQRYLN